MSFNKLTIKERQHLQRAHSQAVYYAHRGFYDACRIHAPELTPELRSRLTGVVGDFLQRYVIPELGYVTSGGEPDDCSDGFTRIAKPDF